MIHVPYKGTGPAMTDLISGQIQVLLDGLPSQISNIKAGTTRPLAAMSEQHSPLLPDVPTMREAGYSSVVGGLWFGLSGPADLPQDIVDRLTAALARLGKDGDFAAKLQSTGVLVTLLPPDGYRKFIESEISRYRKIAHDAGISVD
jgi:tripartite-type tricarboxylate transporter receptor subunit TctC